AASSESASGIKRQKWHYPSRVECMVCHSRAANFVLGLSTAQMNREHDYGGVTEHQFEVLRELGVLKESRGRGRGGEGERGREGAKDGPVDASAIDAAKYA